MTPSLRSDGRPGPALPQYGFSEWSMEDTYSHNYASDDMSWYNTDQAYYLSRDGEYVGSITIYADTATDDLHGIGAYSSDEEAFYQIADVLEATFQEFGYLDTDLNGQGGISGTDQYRGYDR